MTVVATRISYVDAVQRPALAAHVERRLAELEGLCGRILACDVRIERSAHAASVSRAGVRLVLPGPDIIATHGEHRGNFDDAVDAAFDAARHQIEARLRFRQAYVGFV